MAEKAEPKCASCRAKDCRDGKDCFGNADEIRERYSDEKLFRLFRAASAIEARHYCKEHRLAEIILFAKELGVRKIGLAFCIGLASEAETVAEILGRHFDVVSICCKSCGIAKREFGLEQIHPENENEVMCNPVGQAQMLNDAGTELNVICGLCVGHDAIFTMHCEAPVTTLIAKDRVLGHNPAAAIYVQYIRREMLGSE
jgi:uncharacterized metal-binding protein